jgi:glutathione synthase/RimK-type ligase-like ATP-grasp enzyme
MRAAVLVPEPGYPEPWRWAFDAEGEALRSGGIDVVPRAWNDGGSLAGFDLVLPLVAWGYHLRFAEWLAVLDRLERERVPVCNPVPLLRWNSDKAYLAQLAGAGVPTVPSLVVERLDEASVQEAAARLNTDELVIKPPVSASATGTHRLRCGDPLPDDALGKPTIIQPFVPSVAEEGEYSLLLFDGELSHAVIKRPAKGDFRVQPHLGGSTERCEPPAGSEALARQALAAAPSHASYARVDMVRGLEGALQIMELELVEPALWLDLAPGAAGLFVAAVRGAVDRLREQPLAQG